MDRRAIDHVKTIYVRHLDSIQNYKDLNWKGVFHFEFAPISLLVYSVVAAISCSFVLSKRVKDGKEEAVYSGLHEYLKASSLFLNLYHKNVCKKIKQHTAYDHE